jgi:hypothetical protein
MPSDPDHVLDAIDGIVDEWETMSADAMRWAPPEHKSPDFMAEVTEIFGPLANAFAQALRPVSDAFERVLHVLDDDGPVRPDEPGEGSVWQDLDELNELADEHDSARPDGEPGPASPDAEPVRPDDGR